jgi:hypothetical protein
VENVAKSLPDYKEYKREIEAFLDYFRKQWMQEKIILLWNTTLDMMIGQEEM